MSVFKFSASYVFNKRLRAVCDKEFLDKIGNNTYMPKNQNELEVIENNDNMIVQGAVESSNVNSVSAMVELIDAHRRFDQSQRAMKSIDEINAGLIDKIGGNTR